MTCFLCLMWAHARPVIHFPGAFERGPIDPLVGRRGDCRRDLRNTKVRTERAGRRTYRPHYTCAVPACPTTFWRARERLGQSYVTAIPFSVEWGIIRAIFPTAPSPGSDLYLPNQTPSSSRSSAVPGA